MLRKEIIIPHRDISAELTDLDKNETFTKIDEAKAKLPFVVNLTMKERQTIPKM